MTKTNPSWQSTTSRSFARVPRAAAAGWFVIVALLSLAACGPGDGRAGDHPVAAATTPPAATTPSPAPPAVVAAPAPQPERVAPRPAASNATVVAAAATYGTVEHLVPITQAQAPSGAGAVIGGVLGAVVGHQFGGGTGRTLSTAAGAVGGAVAGNAVEKQRSTTIVGYRAEVRLDDGSLRTFKVPHPTALAIGSRVHVQGATITAA